MRTLKSLSIVAAMGLVAACGTNSKQEGTSTAPEAKQETKKSSDDEKALESEFAALPSSVIIAVPVDAKGKEQQDKATMRLQGGNAVVSDSNVEATYAASAAPAKLGRGELDADSSTQSWNYYQQDEVDSGYSNGGGYGNQGNNNQGYGQQGNQSNAAGVNISDIRNSNVNVDVTNNYNSQNGSQIGGQGYQGGSGYYSGYRPAAYSTVWTGNYWGYSRPWCFQRPSYNYYVYPRRCSSYSFCGSRNNNWW